MCSLSGDCRSSLNFSASQIGEKIAADDHGEVNHGSKKDDGVDAVGPLSVAVYFRFSFDQTKENESARPLKDEQAKRRKGYANTEAFRLKVEKRTHQIAMCH